jgi:hypothetical protein
LFEHSGFAMSQPWEAAKSETPVQKFKSRQQWLSQPLAGFAVMNQSGQEDLNLRPHGPENRSGKFKNPQNPKEFLTFYPFLAALQVLANARNSMRKHWVLQQFFSNCGKAAVETLSRAPS